MDLNQCLGCASMGKERCSRSHHKCHRCGTITGEFAGVFDLQCKCGSLSFDRCDPDGALVCPWHSTPLVDGKCSHLVTLPPLMIEATKENRYALC